MEHLGQILMLLAIAVTVVVACQRLQIPSSLGYLSVGLIVGPHTAGPVVNIPQLGAFAEFGIVFLLFTIGLNFASPQIRSLRHKIMLLGTGQVVLTTAVVALVAVLAGFSATTAFVIGAIFAQSSSTIIGKQLIEQGEDNSYHGRLGLAMSVFQDVTTVPFVVIIPVLGLAAGAEVLAGAVAWAMVKAGAACAAVLLAGRWLLRPLFQIVAKRRSAEVFTLTVLLVALLSAWTTDRLGLSLAFGAFLAGLVLGGTEFRHQVESAIRPFRDVLLGLFFVGVGMLFDPATGLEVWHWGLTGAAVLLASKTLLVALLVRAAGIDRLTAWRTGLLLGVGGEFGLALLSIALAAEVISTDVGQIALISVLLAMAAGPLIIRFNQDIAARLAGGRPRVEDEREHLKPGVDGTTHRRDHVIICGYGRIGQSVAHFLKEEKIPFAGIDLDIVRVREAHMAGEPVYYGDATERDILEALGVERARLVVISHDDVAAALKALSHLRSLRPDLPVMVRTRDESRVEELQTAGALEVVPETLEAGLMIAWQALLLLDVPLSRVMRRIQHLRSGRYHLLREFFGGDELLQEDEGKDAHRLRSIVIPPASPVVGRRLIDLDVGEAKATALVRSGVRQLPLAPETILKAGDVMVLYGRLDELQRIERLLAG